MSLKKSKRNKWTKHSEATKRIRLSSYPWSIRNPFNPLTLSWSLWKISPKKSRRPRDNNSRTPRNRIPTIANRWALAPSTGRKCLTKNLRKNSKRKTKSWRKLKLVKSKNLVKTSNFQRKTSKTSLMKKAMSYLLKILKRSSKTNIIWFTVQTSSILRNTWRILSTLSFLGLKRCCSRRWSTWTPCGITTPRLSATIFITYFSIGKPEIQLK